MSPRPRKQTSRYEPSGDEGIERDKRSGVLYIRDTIHISPAESRFVERSLKTKSIVAARAAAAEIRNRMIRGEVEEEERRTFGEAFDAVVKIQSTKKGGTPGQAIDIVDGHLRPWFAENCAHLTGKLKRYKGSFEKHYEDVWADYKIEASFRKVPAHLRERLERASRLQDPAAIAKAELRIEEWRGENAEPRKLEHDRRYLVMALKRARIRGWIQKEFSKKDFGLEDVSESIGQYVEDEAVQALLEAARPYPKLHLQVRCALLLGMRISEVLHLAKAEVNLKAREIDLNPKRVKTRRRREVPIPIPDELLPDLERVYKAASGPYLFPAEHHTFEGRRVDPMKPQDDNSFHWNKVRLAAARARARAERPGITDQELEVVEAMTCRFHDLRHTAITNMVKAGLPETAIRKFCGVHETTMRRIYAHIERELKDRFRNLFCGKFVE
jgi:integrase